MGCIYGIRNEVNQKWYIGQSVKDADLRKRTHFTGHGSRLVDNAVKKYGIENFTFHILHDGILNIFLDDYEIQAIKKYNSVAPNGYNLTHGGGGGILSQETRKKISEAAKKRYQNMTHEERMVLSRKGKKATLETRRKQSEAKKGKPSLRKGKKVSLAARRRMSEAFKGRKVSAETRKKHAKRWLGTKNPRSNPYHIPAKQFYLSLPPSMDVSDKRKYVREKFPQVLQETIWKWVRKWESE